MLHCDKPGTGLVDTPRCFSLKLSKITRGECGFQPCSVGPELCIKHAFHHNAKELICLMAKHVDDLKFAGVKASVLKALEVLQKTLGQLKMAWNSFTNCGSGTFKARIQKGVVLGQVEYVKKTNTMSHPSLNTSAANHESGHDLHQLYMSLLGAIAYTTITRPDAVVYVCALQRFNHKPTTIQVKRLNALTRWLQRHPRGLRYRRLSAQK